MVWGVGNKGGKKSRSFLNLSLRKKLMWKKGERGLHIFRFNLESLSCPVCGTVSGLADTMVEEIYPRIRLNCTLLHT